MSDEELMRHYLAGEVEAFEGLYNRHSGRILSYLMKRLPSKQDADEVLQAVFLKFHHSRHNFDFNYAVLQWLFVISRTSVMDFYRKKGREPVFEKNMTEEFIDSDKELPWEAVSDEQKKVLELRYLDEMSFQDIAQKLGKNEDGVRKTVSRAISKMRKALG